MAEYPPKKDQIWSYKNQRFRILGILENGDVNVEKINADNKSSKHLPISKLYWQKRDYELEYGSEESENSEEPEKSEESRKTAQGKSKEKLNPVFTFEYDANINKLVVKKNGAFVTDIPIATVAGQNGKNAYEEWVSRQPSKTKDEDKTFEKFLEIFKGKDGKPAAEWSINEDGYWCYDGVATSNLAVPPSPKDGKDAYEVWAENQPKDKRTREHYEDFIKGKIGKEGQSAFEAWKSLNPRKRQNATLTDFFNWLVEQTEKKIDAKEGASWIPNIIDGKIRFVNDRTGAVTDEYPVKGKDGKSYKPIFVDGKIVFIDDEGHEVTPRHEYRGKSAFEVWRDLPGNKEKNEKDFFDFLKGEKGDPGLNGINIEAKHSYLDIKDWTCPVQTIDTELITNLSGSGKSPDAIIEERMKEIEDKRNEGNKLCENRKHSSYFFFNGNWWYKNWAGWFKEFSWWCAGADRGLLRMCPSDHSKYTGIGTVILFTALMAWFSSYMAMRLVFNVEGNGIGANMAAIGFASFWALMIFFLDRFITNTMYSDGEITISKKEFFGGLPRILIAIFLGIVISAPLELRIFEQDINMQMLNDKTEYVQNYKEVKQLNVEYDSLKAKNDSISSQIKKCEDNENSNKNNKESLANLEKSHTENLRNLENTLSKEIGTFSVSPESPNYERKKSAFDERSRIANEKFKNAKERIDKDYNDKKENLEKALKTDVSVGQLTKDLEKNDKDIKNKKNEIQIAKKNAENKYEKNRNGLSAKLTAMHKLAMEKYEGWQWTGGKDSNKDGKIDYDEESGLGHALHSWWSFLFFTPVGLIMLLFILIDISPVLYKMMLADGVYDNYLHQEKLLKQDKIRLSLARMLRKIDKGELKALSPFIMGKFYRKLSKFSITEDGKFEGVEKDYKQSIEWGENVDQLQKEVEAENKKIFETVLDYKRRIILASYAAWYRDMRDAMIGSSGGPGSEDANISPKSHLFNDMNFENKNSKSEDDEVKNDTDSKKEAKGDKSDQNAEEYDTSSSQEEDPDVEDIPDGDEGEEKPNSDWDDDDVEHKL